MEDLTRRHALKVAAAGVLGVAADADAEGPAKGPAKPAEYRRFDRVEIVSRNIADQMVGLSYIREYTRGGYVHYFEMNSREEARSHALWVPAEAGQKELHTLNAILRIELSEIERQGPNFSVRVRLEARRPDKPLLVVIDETVAIRFFIPPSPDGKILGQEVPYVSFGKLGEQVGEPGARP